MALGKPGMEAAPSSGLTPRELRAFGVPSIPKALARELAKPDPILAPIEWAAIREAIAQGAAMIRALKMARMLDKRPTRPKVGIRT